MKFRLNRSKMAVNFRFESNKIEFDSYSNNNRNAG